MLTFGEFLCGIFWKIKIKILFQPNAYPFNDIEVEREMTIDRKKIRGIKVSFSWHTTQRHEICCISY